MYRVGNVELPDLPPGWPIAVDTEGSGLYTDGDPGTETTTGAPPARVSMASLAYRDPDTQKIVSHAWSFDQGPVRGKPGRTRKPSQGSGYDDIDIEKILSKFDVSYDTATNNIGLDHWIRLLKWLRTRDFLIMHNGKYDTHVFATGPRDDLIRTQWATNPDFQAEFTDNSRAVINRFIETGQPLTHRFGVDLDKTLDFTSLYDTMLVQALFEPLQSVALKATARRLWGENEDEEKRALSAALKKLGPGLTQRYDLVPVPIIEPYAAKDAELTLRLYEHHQALLNAGDTPPHAHDLIDKDLKLMRVLYRMERRGIGYDAETSRAVAMKLRNRMAEIAETLPFDPAKKLQVAHYYFSPPEDGGLGLIPLKTTAVRGDPTVDETQMRELSKQNRPYAKEYDEWSHCASAVSKWYRGWAEKTGSDGRLRTVFQQTKTESDRPGGKGGGAISGRLAVGRVQLQAIPHGGQLPKPALEHPVRSLLGAKPGHVLYEMDLPQGEVRIATVIVNCRAMWDVIDSGEDLHGTNAERIFGCKPGDANYKDLRAVAKRIVFGTLYGAGVRTLRQQILDFAGIDYSERETAEARDAFNHTFPEFSRVARQCQAKADKGLGGPGYVTLIDGRRRWYGFGERTHKAFNSVIQGSLAQTGKTWMIQLEEELPGIQILAIHDSIVVEVPEGDTGRDMAFRAAEIGRRVYEKEYSLRGRVMKFDMEPTLWSEQS